MPSLEQIRAATETGFYVATVAAVIGGLIRYFGDQKERRRQQQQDIDQRQREFRWRQADAARALMADFVSDPSAKHAMQMLDSWSHEYEIDGAKQTLVVAQWQSALSGGPDLATDAVSAFVRESFDALLFHFAMFEHHLRNGFVEFEDVEFPASYYVRIMREDRTVYLTYLKRYELSRAEAFLDRFSIWTTASVDPPVLV
jgi:hypothetical protein